MSNAWLLILAAIMLGGCGPLKKNNDPKDSTSSAEVAEQLETYRQLIAAELDQYGLVLKQGSSGDSALFSCLARVGGAASFDPMILFVDGKPRRHPEINPTIAPTPISKDMINGFLWCAWDVGRKGDKAKSLEITGALISVGLANRDTLGWYFCDEADRAEYKISNEDWTGRCLMTPAVIKDIYRVHQWAGGDCDDTCSFWSSVGVNIPNNRTGFERHLGVLTTTRNGMIEGAINDNSLKQLKAASDDQPRNALYRAAYHLFFDGNQDDAFALLRVDSLFPYTALPTAANYCSDYIFQRDDDSGGRSDGIPSGWLPCGDGSLGPQGRGVDWIFAASIALGELKK